MDPQTAAQNLKDAGTWQRLVFMVLFALIWHVLALVLMVFVVVQFLFRAASGRLFENAVPFAQSMATYAYEIIRFLTFRSNALPWPFAPWPDGTPIDNGEEAEQGAHEVAAGSADTNPPRARRRGPRPTGEAPTT